MAIHEAGHAVLARLLGVAVRLVDITQTNGSTDFEGELARFARYLVLAAGEAAEIAVTGNSDQHRCARDLAMLHDELLDEVEIGAVREAAVALARLARDDIERVARALTDRRSLTGTEVDDVLARAD